VADGFGKLTETIIDEITSSYSPILDAANNMADYCSFDPDTPEEFDVRDFAYDCLVRGVEDFGGTIVNETYDKLFYINTMGDDQLVEHITKHPEDFDLIFKPSDEISEVYKVLTKL